MEGRTTLEGRYDVAVVGGGLVGLATAVALLRRRPDARVVVLEKEDAVGRHQSGRNSGVIHSGIYYEPGSRKAVLARRGGRALREFCDAHGIPHATPGKLIVATDARELPTLALLEERARANGVAARRLGPAGVREREPHVRALEALLVPEAGIVDYRLVCRAYADDVQALGGVLGLEAAVSAIARGRRGLRLATRRGDLEAGFLVNCAGLHCDRIARLAGAEPQARIVPFRGEYFDLAPEAAGLVRGLVYPVPNPAFPFLGVHLTRTIDGTVHAGPNAVLALRREGYRRSAVDVRDVAEVLAYRGFRRLARRHAAEGLRELGRSLSKEAFARSVRRLVPDVEAAHLTRAPAGVRAQAITPDGALVDDFLIAEGPAAVHVLNAPSPGATSSLAIGEEVAALVLARSPERTGRTRADGRSRRRRPRGEFAEPVESRVAQEAPTP